MNFKLKAFGDSIVFDNEDPTKGKATIFCVAPDPETESYQFWPERRDKMIRLWNDNEYKPRRIYLCGPISGLMRSIATHNFKQTELKLQKLGYEVVNPMELPHDHPDQWEEYLKEDIRHLVTCDAIYCLTGYQDSKGAMLEIRIAESLKMEIIIDAQ